MSTGKGDKVGDRRYFDAIADECTNLECSSRIKCSECFRCSLHCDCETVEAISP